MRLAAPLVGFIAARWPHLAGAAQDAGREEQRRALAAFLAAPDAPVPLASAAGAPGFSGTPGIGDAVIGQGLAFRAAAADGRGDRQEALALHARAASSFCQALRSLPDIDDDASDATRQLRLARSLALMLLAHHAAKAELAERVWDRFGTAEEIARKAVAGQPLLPYLRFQHAEVLGLLGRHAAALDAVAEARPLSPDLAARLKLADAAGQVAARSGDPALMARAEAEFVAPLLAEGRDDGPADPPRDAAEAWRLAWIVAFRAGRLDLGRAEAANPRTEDSLALARRAGRRFARAISLMPQDQARDGAGLSAWQSDASRLEAEIALSLGRAAEAARAFARCIEPALKDAAARVSGWEQAARPPRFAAVSLLGPDPWTEPCWTGRRALADAVRDRIDPARVALPQPVEPIVVAVNDPLLTDEALANRIISGTDGPSIAALRRRLQERHAFPLAGVRIRGIADEEAPNRIALLFRGHEAAALTPPEGADLALAHPREAGAAGLAVLPGEAPRIDGLATAWVAPGWRAPGIAVLHPAFAIVGLLEAAVLGAMDRLLGFDEAAQVLPGLGEERLAEGLVVLRHLLRERMPLGLPGVAEEVTRLVAAGERPEAVMARLRALPALWPHLWGNEPGRRAVPLPPGLEREVLEGRLGGLARALAGIEEPVLVVALAARRAAVREALAGAFPDLPVLAASERDGRP